MIAVRTALMVMVATVRYSVPGGGVPGGVAEDDHGEDICGPVDETESRGSPQHYDQAQDNATGNLSLPGLDREERNDSRPLNGQQHRRHQEVVAPG